jgi:hypothetical protein
MARTGIHPYKHLSCAECQKRQARNRSRWCASCAKRQNLTRHPSGKLPRRVVVTPWLHRASRALIDWGMQYEPEAQQMIDAVRRYLMAPHTHEGVHRQLRTMRNFEADPVQMLLRYMAIQGLYDRGEPGRTMHTDHVYWCALGRCVQRATVIPNKSQNPVTGKRMAPVEGSGLVAETIGHDLSCIVGAASRALWDRIEDEEAVRLTEQQRSLDLIARMPDLAKQYPDPKSRRKFARSVTAQRLAYAAISKERQTQPVARAPVAMIDDFDAEDDFLAQLDRDRAERYGTT